MGAGQGKTRRAQATAQEAEMSSTHIKVLRQWQKMSERGDFGNARRPPEFVPQIKEAIAAAGVVGMSPEKTCTDLWNYCVAQGLTREPDPKHDPESGDAWKPSIEALIEHLDGPGQQETAIITPNVDRVTF